MKLPLGILFILIVAIGSYFVWDFKKEDHFIYTNFQSQSPKPKPLEKYAYESLSNTEFKPSEITIGDIVKEEKDHTSRMFYYSLDPFINSGDLKKVSGLINLPNKPGTYPVIVMLRGFVEKEIFKTGIGTQRAGEYFAQNGFITLAPDFLGYGDSDNPSANPIEERFQTYVTVLTLLKSIPNLNSQLSIVNSQLLSYPQKIGLWAHSNGGQIALSVLEITGANHPTVLWAPVSKPFPYSILYFTDDFDDHGKMLRSVVADFEKDYDSEKYSPPNFLYKINAPIALYQGSEDEAVPLKWSNSLYEALKKLDKNIVYSTYPNEDHNFSKGSWQTIVENNIEFYLESFEAKN